MILSRRHRYIFVHCRKTGGSAVKVSLYRSLGPVDVGMGAWGDAADHGIRPNMRTVAYALSRPGLGRMVKRLRRGQSWASAFNHAAKVSLQHRLRISGRHATARDIRTAFPREWDEYPSFCVVRNPFDRAVSDYRWRTRGLDSPPSFRTYLTAIADGDRLGGLVSKYHDTWKAYTVDDRIVVDHVIRFENLADELGTLFNRLGVEWDGWLPHVKASSRPNGTWREHYGDVERALVERIYCRELEEFGYSF